MFFDTENLCFNITEVLSFDQYDVNWLNRRREYNALSFRIAADTDIISIGETLHLTDNNICFVPANVDYKRVTKRDKLIVVHFDILNASFDKIETIEIRKTEKLRRYFEEMLDLWTEKPVGFQYKVSSIFYNILSECIKQTTSPAEMQNPIWNSVKFLETNFMNSKITIKEIAEKSFMSEVYFRKLFKKAYNISPVKYIINLRLENAINLMRTGYYTLNEAARLSGYEDYSYFSAEFKRLKGVAPSKYFD